MRRAGLLEPVLRGLLTKDPAQRITTSQASRQLSGVLSSPAPPAASQPSTSPRPPSGAASGTPQAAAPPQGVKPVPGGSAIRIDAADLKALASASRAVLGHVARDVGEHLVDLRREKKVDRRRDRRAAAERAAGPPQRTAAPTAQRRRFKRRWVVVPVLATVGVVALVIIGALVALAAFFGLL